MSNSICLFTVVYPGCKPFLNRFFQSVNDQEFTDFDLFVLNDGFADLNNYTGGLKIGIEEIPVSGTIAQVRNEGLRILMEQPYEKIVFADADDSLSPDRVGNAIRALEHVDIYVNDLAIVNQHEELIKTGYFSERLENGFEPEIEFILQKNIFGLGNSSARKSVIQEIQIPESAIAVDWIIFSDMLLRGCSAVFKNDSSTYYRQHEQNIAGFKPLTPERIDRALQVQLQNATRFAPTSAIHKEHLTKLLKLKSYLSDGEQNVETYLKNVEKILPEYSFWWEEIKTLDQLSL